MAQWHAGTGGRPQLVHPPRLRAVGLGHRDARDPAPPGGGRDRGVVPRRDSAPAVCAVAGVGRRAPAQHDGSRAGNDVGGVVGHIGREPAALVRRVMSVACAAALIALLAACGSDSKSSSDRKTVEVTITDAGCDPAEVTVPPGSTTFHVKNDGADAVTEFEVIDSTGKIIGEKENLTPGLSGEFTIALSEGQYTLACPGGTEHPTGSLIVSGSGSGSGDAHGHPDEAAECVPSGSSEAATAHVAATLSDFKIELASPTVANGSVAIDGTNNGTHPHEIVVVKGVPSADLPTSADGSVDEDRLPAGAMIGEVEAFSPGRSCSATFALDPGTYTLFCNISGEEGAHFKLGMVTSLTVS